MTPATHHGQVHTGAPTRSHDPDDVDIIGTDLLHRLLLQYPRKRPHLVAQHRRLLEVELFRRGEHAAFNIFKHVIGMAIEKPYGPLDVALIVFGRDQIDTRRRTSADLMQQAWA